jgi:hypothetical protein
VTSVLACFFSHFTRAFTRCVCVCVCVCVSVCVCVCYRGFTVVLPGRGGADPASLAWVLQWCYNGVTVVLP